MLPNNMLIFKGAILGPILKRKLPINVCIKPLRFRRLKFKENFIFLMSFSYHLKKFELWCTAFIHDMTIFCRKNYFFISNRGLKTRYFWRIKWYATAFSKNQKKFLQSPFNSKQIWVLDLLRIKKIELIHLYIVLTLNIVIRF